MLCHETQSYCRPGSGEAEGTNARTAATKNAALDRDGPAWVDDLLVRMLPLGGADFDCDSWAATRKVLG